MYRVYRAGAVRLKTSEFHQIQNIRYLCHSNLWHNLGWKEQSASNNQKAKTVLPCGKWMDIKNGMLDLCGMCREGASISENMWSVFKVGLQCLSREPQANALK